MASESKLGVAQIEIRATLDKLDTDLDEAKGKTSRAADEAERSVTSKMGNVVAKIGLGLVGAAGAAGVALGKLAMDAMPLAGIRDAFQGITGDADSMLAALREGSAGMVRDTDLMMSYNQAAQLVGKTFADQLPSAMGYLGKVSSATGQDMGFLLDSLVKGVGRLSPAILDNLAIQVSLAQATDRASQMFGKEAGALSKSELQAGMMNVVLEKLAENTAAMPAVVGSAAQQWGTLKTTMVNLKDQAGLALLPVLSALLGILLPIATAASGSVGPAIQSLSGTLAPLVGYLRLVVSDGDLLNDWLMHMPAGIRPAVMALGLLVSWVGTYAPVAFNVLLGVVTGVLGSVWSVIVSVLSAAVAFWQANHETISRVTSTVFGAIWAVVSGILSTAWAFVQQIVLQWVAFWTANYALIQAVTTTVLQAIWTVISTVLNVIRAFWQSHGNEVIAIVSAAWTIITTTISTAISLVQGVLRTVMQLISGDWSGAWDTIKATASTVWSGILTIVQTFGQMMAAWLELRVGVLRDVLAAIWGTVRAKVEETWNGIIDWLRAIDLAYIGRNIIESMKRGVVDKANSLISAVRSAVGNAIDAAKRLLGIGSPSKVFTGFGSNVMLSMGRGVAEAAGRALANIRAAMGEVVEFPRLGLSEALRALELARLNLAPEWRAAPGLGGLARGGDTISNTRAVTLNVTQNRLDDPRTLRDMVRLMEYGVV